MVSFIQRWAMPTFFLHHLILCAGAWALVTPFETRADEASSVLRLHIQDVALSDGLPVRHLDGDWHQDYKPNEANPRAMRSAEFEMGWKNAWGTWSFIERKEAFLQLNADTASLLALYQQKTDPVSPTTNRSAQSRFLGWHGHGGSWKSKAWTSGGTDVRWRLQGFRLSELRQYSTEGIWQYEGNNAYNYAVGSADANSRQKIPEGVSTLQTPTDAGWGWSVSLDITQQIQSDHRLRFTATDAFSQLRWSGLVAQEQSLNSSVKSRNSAGFIDYAPFVTGRYVSADVLTKIPPGWTGMWQWQVNPSLETTASWSERFGMQQRWLGTNYRLEPLRLGVAIEPMRQAKQISLTHSNWRFAVAWDRFSPGRGQLWSGELTLLLPLN